MQAKFTFHIIGKLTAYVNIECVISCILVGGSIMKFAESSDTGHTYTIVTYEEERVIESGGIVINVVPLMKFLINI